MRLRVAEIMREQGLTTYALHQKVQGVISRSSLYRMVDDPKRAHLATVEIAALCEVLGVSPNELYDYKPKRGKAS
jgi:DNA-binding Xre family transcriptional regulator